MSHRNLLRRYMVTDGSKFDLRDIKPSDTGGLPSEFKDNAKTLLREGVERMAALQDRLSAQNRWGLLLIFQAMDAAGKDSAIEHVMSGVNPQGCQVTAFKSPSSEELDHDFLWRTSRALPERGRIGIFNRSYYEEVLIVRVHQGILAAQRLPHQVVTKRIWKERLEDIAAHERYLHRQGYAIRKFFLHVSKAEQKRRFLARLDTPEKNWKFEAADVKERQHWKAYMDAYEDAIRRTAAPHAPWVVLPADNKWYTRLMVSAAVVEALEELELEYPSVDATRRVELKEARQLLEAE
jgi:PPK2 family polyphosphate:nucleotide phosphotransferase